MNNNFDVVIVGGGHAGSHLANILSRNKYPGSVAVINDENALPYHRPPLSKECITDAEVRPRPLFSGGTLSGENIKYLQNHHVTGGDLVERKLNLADGNTVTYKKLVIATGSQPRALTIPGSELAGIMSLKTLVDVENIRQKLAQSTNIVLVGGGFISLELACSLAGSHRNITVLERNERLLQRAVSPGTSEFLRAKAEALGVEVCFGANVVKLTGENGHVNTVITCSGREIPADLVVVAIGSVPEVTLGSSLGLECRDGILVDQNLRASADVYSMGDCVRFPEINKNCAMRLESVQNATDQATYIAAQLMGEEQDAYQALAWFWSIQGPSRLQIAGLWEPGMSSVSSYSDCGTTLSVYHYAGDKLCAVETVNRPGEHLLARKILNTAFSPTRDAVTAGLEMIKAQFDDFSK